LEDEVSLPSTDVSLLIGFQFEDTVVLEDLGILFLKNEFLFVCQLSENIETILIPSNSV